MFSSFRNRFGIPSVISVIALVFAMFGGAYAASNDSGSGAKATASAKKGPRGPRGPKGPAGPAGPQGPAGAAGAKGDKGDTGAAGSNGSQGPIGPTGKTGATGATGATGLSGFTETLPSKKTETGTWVAGPNDEGAMVPLSFNIPLENAPVAVHFVKLDGKEYTGEKAGVTPVNCLGEAEDPTAPPGHVCIYEAFNFEVVGGWSGSEFFNQVYATGVTFLYGISKGQVASGTFAVTAP